MSPQFAVSFVSRSVFIKHVTDLCGTLLCGNCGVSLACEVDQGNSACNVDETISAITAISPDFVHSQDVLDSKCSSGVMQDDMDQEELLIVREDRKQEQIVKPNESLIENTNSQVESVSIGKPMESQNPNKVIKYVVNNPTERTILEKDGFKYRLLNIPCVDPGNSGPPIHVQVYACVLCSKLETMWPNFVTHMTTCHNQNGNTDILERGLAATNTGLSDSFSVGKAKTISQGPGIKEVNVPEFVTITVAKKKVTQDKSSKGIPSGKQATTLTMKHNQGVKKIKVMSHLNSKDAGYRKIQLPAKAQNTMNSKQLCKKTGALKAKNKAILKRRSLLIQEEFKHDKNGACDPNKIYQWNGIPYRRIVEDEVQFFYCTDCEFKCNTWKYFKLHKQQEIETSDPDKIHELDGLSYKRKIWNDIAHFFCCLCDYRCRTWEAFRRHSLQQHSTNNKLQEYTLPICHICGKTYTRKSVLDVHINAVHSKETTYTCDQCGYTTGYYCALLSHIKNIHTKPYKYPCPWLGCTKMFITKGNLQRHLPVHTGERKFKCKRCLKDFKSQSNLGQHVKRCGKMAKYV